MLRKVNILIIFFSFLKSDQNSIILINSLTGSPLNKIKCNYAENFQSITNSHGKLNLSESVKDSVFLIDCESYHPKFIKFNISNFIKLKPVVYKHNTIKVEAQNNLSDPTINHPTSLIEIEKLNLSQSNISQIFKHLPGMMIKSYGGAGGIKTLSLYGSQGDRVQLQINGIVINNEQSGNADISQIPSAIIQKLQYIPIGSGSRYGNSAMAGVINVVPNLEPLQISANLDNNKNFDFSLFKNLAGDNWKAGIGLGKLSQFQKIKWFESGNYNFSESEHGSYNWFTSGLKQKFLSLNAIVNQQKYKLKLNGLKVKNNRNLSGKVYFQESHPNIKDGLDLISIQVISQNQKFSLSHKLQSIHYKSDPVILFPIDAKHKIKTTNIQIERILLNTSFFSTFKILNNYSNQTIPNDTSSFQNSIGFSKKIIKKHANIFSSYRLNLQKKNKPIHSWELILDKYFNYKPIRTSIIFSRNFKKPGFNDLFWKPFGNNQLKTEFSNNFYLKIRYLKQKHQISLTIFSINYNNLIQWLPQTGGQDLWRPENVNKAKSNGITFVLTGESKIIGGWIISGTNNFTKNKNTGIELPYSPKWIYSLAFKKYINSWTISQQTQAISSRLNTITDYLGNPWELPGYTIFNININKSFLWKKFLIIAGIDINNALNMAYQSVYGYPEPGRIINFQLTLKQRNS